jgi:Asp-tRNA(Asn)/Glu-tRNA(Gln) amidotransferase B subunit
VGRVVERGAELEEKRGRYVAELGVAAEQADVLTRDAAVAAFFDDALTVGARAAAVAKWLVNEVPREARERIGELPVGGRAFGQLVELVEAGEISSSAGREVLAELLAHGGEAGVVIERLGLRQVSDEASLRGVVDEVVVANEGKAAAYRDGKTGLLGFFIGQVMAKTGGRANPAVVKELVQQRLVETR